MEKLELKHLAPYLPYGLKVSSIHTLNAQNGIGNINHVIKAVNEGKSQYKPILRPLSYLTKEIEHNGKKFVPVEKLRLSTKERTLLIAWGNESGRLTYNQSQKLFEWKFDIFGLIEKGLAVDINATKEK